MVRTRLQYLEQQLVESKTVWDEEKSAHARMKRANVCTIERLADSERKLRELERKLSESERDRRLAKEHAQDMALVCKVRGGFDTSDTTGMGHVAQYTDDVSLSKRLPSIPSHLWHTSDATSPTLHPTCPTSTTRDGDKASRDVEHEPAVKAEFKTSKQLRHSHEEIDAGSGDDPSHKAPDSPGRRVVVCIECYIDNRRCDPGEPCRSCVDNGTQCIRAKCNDYGIGKCQRQGCLRAHASDKRVYKKLVWAGHVSRKDKVKLPSKQGDEQDNADEED